MQEYERLQLQIRSGDEDGEGKSIADSTLIQVTGPRDQLLQIIQAGVWLLGGGIEQLQDGQTGQVVHGSHDIVI